MARWGTFSRGASGDAVVTQEFERYVDLPADLRFVPVRQIGSLVFRAAEEAGISDDAAFDYGFRVGPEHIAKRVRHWRDAGKLRVFMLGGLGTLDGDDVLQGVLRREDFAAFAADEFHTGVTEPAGACLTPPLGAPPAGPARTKDEPAPLSVTGPANVLAPGIATGEEAQSPQAPSEAATVQPPPAGPAAVIRHSTKEAQRRDILDPVIELAQSKCLDPMDTAQVLAQLQVLAQEEHAPLLASTNEGIKYAKKGNAAYLTRDALDKRLHPERREKRR